MVKAKSEFKSIKWGYSHIKSIPATWKGIYVIWNPPKKKCFYVGQAKDQSIRNRLLQHWAKSHNEELRKLIKVFGKYLEVCYIWCERDYIDHLEKKLIKHWKPEANNDMNPNKSGQ